MRIHLSVIIARKKNRGNLLVISLVFVHFWKASFRREPPISTGRNSRLKPAKLLNLNGHIDNKMRRFPISYFDIQGAVALQTVIVCFYLSGITDSLPSK